MVVGLPWPVKGSVNKPIFRLSKENGLLFWDRSMRKIVWALTFSLSLTAVGASPVLAASRSKTVTVSCVIAPQIGLTSPRPVVTRTDGGSSDPSSSGQAVAGLSSSGGGVKALGNLGRSMRLQEETRSSGSGRPTKLFTVTAL